MTIDSYVCGNCPGASDMNPGTQQSPVATIGRGITNAVFANRPTVFIATSFGGTAHTYSEDVTLVQGRSLQGRWTVTSGAGGLVWTRNGARSTLQNTADTGLKAPLALTNATIVEGMLIRQASLASMRLVGISVNSSSPILRDLAVTGPLLSTGAPTESIGIDVLAGFAGSAVPRIEGTGMVRNLITPRDATTSSTGLRISNASAQVTFTDFTAGAAGASSQGVYLTDSPTTSIQDSTLSAGLSLTCFGFLSQGTASGVVLDRVTASGCPRTSTPPPVIPRAGYGIAFDACGGSPGGTAPIVRNASATGGAVGGVNSVAVGGAALDGCNVRFESMGTSTSSYTGASSSATGAPVPVETAAGISCTYRGLRTASGLDSRCSVSGSNITGGFVGTARSIGLVCDGTCATQGASCLGSCGEVVGNSITAGTGNPMAHVYVANSSPQVRQNRIGFGGNGTFCGAGTAVRGVELTGSSGSFVNNLILAGPCTNAMGVEHFMVRRTFDMSVPSPTFNSNTIGGSTPLPSIGGTVVSVGVSVVGPMGSPASLQSGVWLNNIIFAGPVTGTPGARQVAFEERGTGGDPTSLTNNLYQVFGAAMSPTLYLDEGATPLSTTSAINTLTGTTASGSVTGDPLFSNAGIGNYALSSGTSPASRAGATTGAPTTDLNAGVGTRPNPVGTNPDIGCLEASF